MKFLTVLLLLCAQLSANCIDLEEEFLQDFVLETKKIEIPHFPYAFNPSLVKWNGLYLLSFRAGKEYTEVTGDTPPFNHFDESEYATLEGITAPSYSPNRIGLVWLDENFNPLTKPQLLDVPNDNSTYRQQDPRLVVVENRLYMIYSEIVKAVLIPQTRRMVIVELAFDGFLFHVKEAECIREYDGEFESRWEKNWVPFDFENRLLLAYSINPHKILYPLLEQTGICATIAKTEKKLDWKWGHLRGGTPAILESEDQYLSIFHSSTVMPTVHSEGVKRQHYFMGAYTFSSRPPFELKSISATPIVGKNFYNGPKHKTWKPLIVVYPGGIVLKGNAVYVAYGRQDHEIWIATFDRAKLLASMVTIN